jgi:hypothetical protein
MSMPEQPVGANSNGKVLVIDDARDIAELVYAVLVHASSALMLPGRPGL